MAVQGKKDQHKYIDRLSLHGTSYKYFASAHLVAKFARLQFIRQKGSFLMGVKASDKIGSLSKTILHASDSSTKNSCEVKSSVGSKHKCFAGHTFGLAKGPSQGESTSFCGFILSTLSTRFSPSVSTERMTHHKGHLDSKTFFGKILAIYARAHSLRLLFKHSVLLAIGRLKGI